MIPLFKKPSMEELISKDLFFTTFQNWVKRGTVWTPNNFDYNFIFKEIDDTIDSININNLNLYYVSENLVYLPSGNPVSKYYHKSKGVDSPTYTKLNDILNEALLNSKWKN